MKIEIVSGTKTDIPSGKNTSIKIDGKEFSKSIDYLYFYITTADAVAHWNIGFRDEPFNLIRWLKRKYYWLYYSITLRKWF